MFTYKCQTTDKIDLTVLATLKMGHSLLYQLNDVNPLSAEFPLIGGSLVNLLAILGPIWMMVYLTPKVMRTWPPMDLKPYLLIYNAIMFGGCFSGSFLGLWVSEGLRVSFVADETIDVDQLKPMFASVLAYIFFWMSLSKPLPRLIAIAEKRPQSSLDLGHLVAYVMFIITVYIGLRIHPYNCSCAVPVTLLIADSFKYGLRILATSAPPLINYKHYEFYIIILYLCRCGFLAFHVVWFALIGTSSPKTAILITMEALTVLCESTILFQRLPIAIGNLRKLHTD